MEVAEAALVIGRVPAVTDSTKLCVAVPTVLLAANVIGKVPTDRRGAGERRTAGAVGREGHPGWKGHRSRCSCRGRRAGA